MNIRQKKFYRIDRFLLIYFIFMLLSIFTPYISIQYGKFIWWTVLTPLLFISSFILYYRYLKKHGYNATNLEPSIYKLSPIDYKTIIKVINSCLKTEMKALSEDEDLSAVYSITNPRGLILRLLLMKIGTFDRETFKSAKERFNKKINKIEEIEQLVTRSEAARMVRVNFIIIESLNPFAEELVNQNASYLMSRVEGIINVVYTIKESNLYIPTLFGDSYPVKHIKVHKLILKIFKDYLVEVQ